MKLRYKLGIIVTALLAAFLYGRCAKPKTTGPGILPKDDKEQIIVDPDHNSLIIRRPMKPDQHLTLPDRPSTFDIKNDGTVKVTSAQMGWEEHPFIGGMISDQFRFAAGSDLFFYKKLDLGLGIGINRFGGSFVGLAKVSYNVWSNTQISMTYDTGKHIGAMLSVRI